MCILIYQWGYDIMYFLENVFRSNSFDLNDAVLTDYDIYFDENSKKYNSFSLDDEDLPNLHRFIKALKVKDPNSKFFVLTYGCDLISDNGKKYTYADQLWIDTNLGIYEVKNLVSVIGLTEPSAIRYFCNCNEIEYYQVYLISRSKNGESIISKIEKEKVNQVITLYWD